MDNVEAMRSRAEHLLKKIKMPCQNETTGVAPTDLEVRELVPV